MDAKIVLEKRCVASTCQAWIQVLVNVVGVISFGCSHATGPFFQPAEGFVPDHCVVYLYFPIQIGLKDGYTVLANGTVLTKLEREGYYPFVTRPGRIIFAIEGWPKDDHLTLDVQADREYFVRVSLIGRGMFTYNRYYQLELASPEVAIQEIKNLRLMDSCPTTRGCTVQARG